MRTVWPWLLSACFAALGAFAEPVELLLRNPLAEPMVDRLVVCPLDELGIEDAAAIASATVTGPDGQVIPAQLDRFGDGLAPELVLRVTLGPHEERLLSIVFAAGEPSSRPVEPSTLQTAAGTWPVGSFGQNGLRLEQPVTAGMAKPRVADPVDDLLDDAFDAPATATAATGNLPQLPPPMRPDGLPWCLLGMEGFSAQAVRQATAGPHRATVSLVDAEATWSLGGQPVRVSARQTFWTSGADPTVYLDVAIVFHDPVERARLTAGGLQLNTQDRKWRAAIGQYRQPPLAAPVTVPLRYTRKTPYLEGYQRASFSHVWACATTDDQALPALSVATVVDRVNSRFGSALRWDDGRFLLDTHLQIDDMGPGLPSLYHQIDAKELPAGFRARLRFAFPMAIGRDATDPAWVARFEADPAVYRLPSAASRLPDSDLPDIPAELAAPNPRRPVLVRLAQPSEAPWEELAARLGAPLVDEAAVRHYLHGIHGGNVPDDTLVILPGYPGSGPLFDRLNQTRGLIDAYPAAPPRARTALVADRLIVIAANRPAALAEALKPLLAALPAPAPSPPLVVNRREWSAAMPTPWALGPDETGPFHATAWPGGHAEFLFLLRSPAGYTIELPAGATARWVAWHHDTPEGQTARPLNDAALPSPPNASLNGLTGLWISLPVAADAAPGIVESQAILHAGDGSRALVLQTEVLAIPLREPALGFNPMGFSKDAITQYYDWDEATYLEHLPALFRQAHDFGVTSYQLDVRAIGLEVNEEGGVRVDLDRLRRELAAIRQVAEPGYVEIVSLNHLQQQHRAVFAELARRHGLADETAAWELVAPALRQALATAGLERAIACRHDDEIGDYAKWLERARVYRAAGFRMTVAINSFGVAHKEEGVGTMDVWIPLYNFYLNRWGKPIADDEPEMFSRQFRDACRARGEPIWPYVCGPGPYAWSPRPRSQARFLVLDTWQKGADGLSYYGGMVWSHALDPAYRRTRQADLFGIDATFTSLFYPDPQGQPRLHPSLRAVVIRMGLEDTAALATLRRHAAERGQAAAIEAAIADALAPLQMNSRQADFDQFRHTIDRLFRQLN